MLYESSQGQGDNGISVVHEWLVVYFDTAQICSVG